MGKAVSMGAAIRFWTALALLTWSCTVVVANVKEASSVGLTNVLATATKPILLEFYSPDCHHCKELEPVLEEVSKQVKGKAIVMRLDMRTTYKLNRQFGVRASPTLLLFKGGREVLHSREDLGALRDSKGISTYVMMHVGDDVQALQSVEQIDALVQDFGLAVVGVFESTGGKEAKAFRSVAQQWRRYMPFTATENATAAGDVQTAFQAGNMSSVEAVSDFVKLYGLPLVGHLNSFTYPRFRELDATKVFFFYDPADSSGRREEKLLQSVAANNSGVVFVAASIYATEASEQDRLHLKVGVSDYRLPALAVVAPKGAGSIVYNQLQPITVERLLPFFQRFLHAAVTSQCQVDGWRSEAPHSSKVLEEYAEYADMMKERIYTNRAAMDISEQAYRKTEKRTRLDILTIYTARWCVYSLQFEQLLQDIVDSGELDDILGSDLEIKTVDVVLHPPFAANRVDTVPSMRYLPARYKTYPFYFRGDFQDRESVLEWIRAYHTMRYVEIPGEAPSPFLKDLLPDSVNNAEWLTDITKESELLMDLDDSLQLASEL